MIILLGKLPFIYNGNTDIISDLFLELKKENSDK